MTSLVIILAPKFYFFNLKNFLQTSKSLYYGEADSFQHRHWEGEDESSLARKFLALKYLPHILGRWILLGLFA